MGLGINYTGQAEKSCLQQLWLEHKKKGDYSRNQIVALLIDQLLDGLILFSRYGFGSFCSDWQKRDILKGTQVQVRNGETIGGLCEGVDERGALLVRIGEKN